MARTRTGTKRCRAAILTEKARVPFSKKMAAKYAEKALTILGRKACIVNILFVNDAGIRRLNRKFKKRDGATDVLAFDTGDIAISVDAARRNSRRFGNSLAEELRLCMAHGILHLSGYEDNSTETRRQMRKMEARILEKL